MSHEIRKRKIINVIDESLGTGRVFGAQKLIKALLDKLSSIPEEIDPADVNFVLRIDRHISDLPEEIKMIMSYQRMETVEEFRERISEKEYAERKLKDEEIEFAKRQIKELFNMGISKEEILTLMDIQETKI